MTIQRHNCTQLDPPVGPYVHTVRHQQTLYTSGITAFGTPAQLGSISEQAEAIFAQLKLLAEQQQSDLSRLLKVTLFVSDLSDMQHLRDTLFKLYGEQLPASSLVKVDSLFLPELLIEVEAIFALS